MKKKLVFIGDTNSINVELISKSHNFIKKKVKYLIIGNSKDLESNLRKLNSNLKINLINDPINFTNYDHERLNLFNIHKTHSLKYKNLLNQINISNYLSSITKIDLITMPVNKSVFKKEMNFTGMTEYLGKLNNKSTIMLMHGEKFSVIPITTHINLKDVNKRVKTKIIQQKLKHILQQINKEIYNLKINKIKFLCFNPHCSENNTLGNEDSIIKKSLQNFKKILGPYSADSAFNTIIPNSLFISMYHDQALIPFKIMNKKRINLTLGLPYRRLSPAHGTAIDIKYKLKADNSSYIECIQF